MIFNNTKHIQAVLFILAAVVMESVAANKDYPNTPKSFSSAKKIAHIIYKDHQVSFYCDCSYSGRKKVDATSCGYQARKNAKRGKSIEWEHIVPAQAFGHTLTCWNDTGSISKCYTKKGKKISARKCCARVNPLFKIMEADLHNLVPAVGELNADRSNYSFSILPGEKRVYGACDFEVNNKMRKTEPAPSVRGNIARTYFYFEDTYGLKISRKQRQLFNAWHKSDPVDQWECERNNRIKEIQANSNTYVSDACSLNQRKEK